MTKDEMKPIDTSKYKITETGQVLKMTKDEMKDRISMALKDPVLQQGFEIICKENAELKEIKELFSRLNKEQSEAILELKMRIEEMESSSKHWDEIHRGSKITGLDTANELKTQKQLVRAKAIIKEMLSILPKENIEGIYEITENAEQFLRELEE